jgi:hypothetical protein
LIGLAAIRPAAKFTSFAIAGLWISVIFAIGALGGFAAGVAGPFPTQVVAFLVLMTGGLVAFLRWPAFRNALLSVPPAGLIGINASRIVDISFLILHDQGRLAAPFATSAGWGDVITGVAAIPLAVAATRGRLPRGMLICLEWVRHAGSDCGYRVWGAVGAGYPVSCLHGFSWNCCDGDPSVGRGPDIVGAVVFDGASCDCCAVKVCGCGARG